MSGRVVIVGIGGQDGTLLRLSLERRGIEVFGVGRQGVFRGDRLSSGFPATFSTTRQEDVEHLVRVLQPDEVYYLAAHHTSSERCNTTDHPDNFIPFHKVHVDGFLNFLWAISQYSRHSRIFYAASSLVFDGSAGPVQNEDTAFSPVDYYGLTKMQGIYLCRHFRKSHGVHASAGILYSHESVLRKDTFLSKKLIRAAHEISLGLRDSIHVGSLQAQNDWGYAPDYVEAFESIVHQETPGDYVVATGEMHTVAEFARIVFDCFGLDEKHYVTENPDILNRVSLPKAGDATKLRQNTGWQPKQSFESMVERLVVDYLRAVTSNRHSDTGHS